MYRDMRQEDKDLVLKLLLNDGKNGRKEAKEYLAHTYGIQPRTVRDWVKNILDEYEANRDSVGVTLNGKSHGLMVVKGTTTLVDEDGRPKLQWVKEDVKKGEEVNGFIEGLERFLDKRDISINPVKYENVLVDSGLMVKYPIADAHLGLLTYEKQVGEDWDLSKAVEAFTAGVRLLVNSAPSSEVCLVLDLGDMLHVADSTGKTRGHGHQLDVSGRLDEIFEAAITVIVTMIDECLKKHKYVIFRKTIGNHDGDTSLALGVFLKRLYAKNNRVSIEADADLFWWYKFGSTLHFSTHGHTVKQKDLPDIIAADCKSVWSECKYVYADTGHVHHQEVLETRTVKCESHNSLVPGDSFNYGSGYRSGRLLKAITYDSRYGEIARNIVNMEMIYAKIRN